jgi:hypothetical protein
MVLHPESMLQLSGNGVSVGVNNAEPAAALGKSNNQAVVQI